MKHKLGLVSLVAIGVGSMLGSGWLFSAYYAAKYSGSGAYFAWLLTAIIVLLFSLIIAEIVTFYPKRGLFTRLLTLSHNHDIGYITALANWLGMMAVIPAESEATVQYLSHLKPSWSSYLLMHGQLTTIGILLCVLFLLFYYLVNFWGAKSFAKANNVITLFKVIVPIITSIAIIWASFHLGNFTSFHHQLLPYGLYSVFAVVMSSGMIYAFNGFQSIASFCTETKHPEKLIPRAMITAVILCLVVYLLLQTAFIGGLSPAYIVNGWHHIVFNSPFIELATLFSLNLVVVMIYINVFVSPSGAALVFTAASTRMLTAMAQERQVPHFFHKLHPKYHFSRRSLSFNMILSVVLLIMFPSWQQIAVVISLFHVISYMACPLSLMRLRITQANHHRPYRLPLATFICPLLFALITILLCSAMEKYLILVTGVVVAFYLLYVVIHYRFYYRNIMYSLCRSYMLPLYFIMLNLLKFFQKAYGQQLSSVLFYSLVVLVGLIFYVWLVYFYRDKTPLSH